MTIKLDKTQDDVADVFPPENGAHFYWKGFYFDVNGELVKHPDLFDEKAAAKLARLTALETANAAAKEARRKALEAAGQNPDELPEDDETANEKDEKIDLKAWLRGKERIIFPHVQKAIQDQYGANPTSKKQAVEFLVGELNLVSPEDVNVL